MTDQLLTTKLYAPPLRPGLVSRPRLVQKLNQTRQQGARLTLFSAPAGYGKTTLALEWLASLRKPYAWLSLDRTDNLPLQFLRYLIAALQLLAERNPQLFPARLEDLNFPTANPEDVQHRLTFFINQIAEASAPFVLVLDDYHTISDLAVHQAVEFLIDHQPPQMHLVITTRQDPLLPLSKLRSRGQVTEIRMADLRFTPEESTAFLNGTMKLALIDEQIASLESRTEGWIAGLQLAALSLADAATGEASESSRRAAVEFIRHFAGDDRHIMDYLLDEVLSRQPEDVQDFLLRTSILKRLCAPLCDAVCCLGAETDRAGKEAPGARAILEYLERANLFTIPLDNRRLWWRYHHLFADLLSSRLQAAYPDQVALLHRQASLWCEQEGLMTDAVDHALLAEDFDRALRLIEHAARTSIWASGNLPALLSWSRRLPEDALRSRPRLCIYNARALFFTGQIEAAENFLQNAENALRGREKEELWGLLCTNRATFTAMQGDPPAALALADQAAALIPAADLSTHARIAHAVGVAQLTLGAVEDARQAFARAAGLCQQANNRNLGLDVTACLARAEILAGRLQEAGRVCNAAFAGDPGISEEPPATAIHLALAEILFEQNDLAGALEAMETCLRLGDKQDWQHVLWQAYALQSRIYQAQQNWSAAIEAVQRASLTVQRYHNPYSNRLIAAYRASIALAMGDTGAAIQWAQAYTLQSALGGLRDFEELLLARVWIANNAMPEAAAVVERVWADARAAGRGQTVLHAALLRSQIPGLNGSPAGQEEALAWAEREGYLRIFQQAVLPPLPASPPTVKPAWSLTGGAPYAEPLSEREREVLNLIAQGLTNPEIAARLYLSVNTLRAHAANIYRKLDVHNRMEAVTRARQMGLLEQR